MDEARDGSFAVLGDAVKNSVRYTTLAVGPLSHGHEVEARAVVLDGLGASRSSLPATATVRPAPLTYDGVAKALAKRTALAFDVRQPSQKLHHFSCFDLFQETSCC